MLTSDGVMVEGSRGAVSAARVLEYLEESTRISFGRNTCQAAARRDFLSQAPPCARGAMIVGAATLQTIYGQSRGGNYPSNPISDARKSVYGTFVARFGTGGRDAIDPQKGTRYNIGTTEGEISGERTHKRRSAKQLDFLPSLFRAGVPKTLFQTPPRAPLNFAVVLAHILDPQIGNRNLARHNLEVFSGSCNRLVYWPALRKKFEFPDLRLPLVLLWGGDRHGINENRGGFPRG